MLFNSLEFLIFFPVVALLYYAFPQKMRRPWLLLASYFFYMSWNPIYALLIAASTVTTYAGGILIERVGQKDGGRSASRRKFWLACGVVINLGILFFFKYFNFALSSVFALLSGFGLSLSARTFDILLPVGISFYTFQVVGYLIDVYRQRTPAEKNIVRYALFVSFFPQLVAGPIERSNTLLAQINERHHFDYSRVKNGLLLMAWGFFQKIVIADNIVKAVNPVYDNYMNYSGSQIAAATVLFAFQIYCDFSGYTDIARGAARVMGFELTENFRRPYFAQSVRDFWRRWHISLSAWFRDYVYIPLGGGRGSKLQKARNILLTFLVSGLWHGADFSFVLWGGLHGVYQIIGDLAAPRGGKSRRKLKIKRDVFSYKLGKAAATFVLVDFAWIFFRADSVRDAFLIVGRIFTSFNPWLLFDGSLYELGLPAAEFNLLLLFIAVLLTVNLLQSKLDLGAALAKQNALFRWLVYYLLLISIFLFGAFGINQFIYFQF